jgi:murein DD-endopeptidase MepM/ murein hydrolase activator NlpD
MTKTFLLLTVSLLSIHQAHADEPLLRTSLNLVACPAPGSTVTVYANDGKKLGEIKALEQVNRFQGWGDNDVTVGSLKLIRVQIPSKPELNDKYVEESALATAEGCAARTGAKQTANAAPTNATNTATNAAGEQEDDDEEEDENAAPEYEAAKDEEIAAFSLDSEACCKFPLATRPKSFLSGIARFGAGRKKGRVHGGADLYGSRGQAVYSVAPGTVIRAPYVFKSGTLAIDVRHKGGFVVRYGEISGKPFGMNLGAEVREGQQVGEMKYVPGAPSAMTHFELYRGNAKGKLSQPGNNKYSRRGDILNPTPYLLKWEKKK